MADGESANPGEFVMFTTNGQGWQHLGEWKKDYRRYSVPYMIQDTDNLFGPNPTTTINGKSFYGINLNQLRPMKELTNCFQMNSKVQPMR